MRTEVSGKKRLITVIISSVICLSLIIFIIWKMSSLTRNFLNNDDIRANVDCVSVAIFSDASPEEVLKNNAPDIELSQDLLTKISEKKDELCIVNLSYSFYNNTGRDLTGFSMEVSPVKSERNAVYAYSPIKQESSADNLYVLTQSIVVLKKDIDEKYFTSDLPLGFEADLMYKFSYNMEGRSGKRHLQFTTVKREEEVDEYEKLFEKKSDGETAQNTQ